MRRRPLLGVLLAYAVADAGGCPLNESGTQPCVLFGWDAGGLLTGMVVMGWLMLVTLPVGALAALIGSAL